MKRFSSLVELAELVPGNAGDPNFFFVSQEESDFYVSLLGKGVQDAIRTTGNNPIFRGTELIVRNEENVIK